MFVLCQSNADRCSVIALNSSSHDITHVYTLSTNSPTKFSSDYVKISSLNNDIYFHLFEDSNNVRISILTDFISNSDITVTGFQYSNQSITTPIYNVSSRTISNSFTLIDDASYSPIQILASDVTINPL